MDVFISAPFSHGSCFALCLKRSFFDPYIKEALKFKLNFFKKENLLRTDISDFIGNERFSQG